MIPIWTGPDWLPNLYLGCFAFGLLFTLLSTVLSLGHLGGAHGSHVHHGPTVDPSHGNIDITHANGQLHVQPGNPHLSHAHSVDVTVQGATNNGLPGTPLLTSAPRPRSSERSTISPFNLPTILAGITWFGGVGFLLTRNIAVDWLLTLALAVGGGWLGGSIIHFFFAKVLWPAQTPPMNPEEYALPGTPARVVSGIVAGGVGEILYTKGGTRAVAGARSLDGSPLPKGSEVRVVRYERGLAYVVPRLVPDPTAPQEGAITAKLPPTGAGGPV